MSYLEDFNIILLADIQILNQSVPQCLLTTSITNKTNGLRFQIYMGLDRDLKVAFSLNG